MYIGMVEWEEIKEWVEGDGINGVVGIWEKFRVGMKRNGEWGYGEDGEVIGWVR